MGRSVAIFTLANDLHGLVVAGALRDRGVSAFVLETSRQVDGGGVRWSSDPDGEASLLRDREGNYFDPAEIDVVWWRRVNQRQVLPGGELDATVLDLLDNDWKTSLYGVLMTDFRGSWINDPVATPRAENKLLQLRVAARHGLRVPRTLVTQEPHAAREFVRSVSSGVVLKPVRGTALRQIATVTSTTLDDVSDRQIRLCPAIYQEMISGDRHLRVNIFGDQLHAVEIEAKSLDWRRNLNGRWSSVLLEDSLSRALLSTIRDLGLAMGIVDLKLTPEGEPVWLEVNPQGQFLFLEALARIDITTPFVEFLLDSAENVSHSPAASRPENGARDVLRRTAENGARDV